MRSRLRQLVVKRKRGQRDAATLGGQPPSAFVHTGQFNGLFASRFSSSFPPAFDSRLGTLFGGGSDDSAINANPNAVERYIGEVFAVATSFPPPGTAFAAGQVLRVAEHTALFSLLGTTYGGDGRTTFALPDLRRQGPGGTNYVIVVEGIFPSRP